MTDYASSLGLEEYKALRATIRERGSLRFLVASITFSVWAAATIAVAAYVIIPMFAVVPLVVLAAGFEIIFAMHVGVERIGRFVQLRYESSAAADGPSWEHTAMRLGLPAGGAHSLFLPAFLIAATLNWLLGLLLILGAASPDEFRGFGTEIFLFGICHVVAIARWLAASRFARHQRAMDLATMSKLLVSGIQQGGSPDTDG